MRVGSAGAASRKFCGAAVAAVACAGLVNATGAKTLTEPEVAEAVTRMIGERSRDGVFTLHDPTSGQSLALVLDDIRVMRGLPEFGWFPDVVFHDKDAPQKKYTVDFWLLPDGNGLKLMDVRVHKDARPDGSSWMMITRAPLLWWWLPTLKRASAVEGTQAWQVMGRVHAHVVEAQKDGAYPLAVADGKTVPTELIAIYQPVGRAREDGRYFACAELRKMGEPTASYAVDFRLDPNARSVTVGTARLIEIPRAGTGKAASEPPCRFEGLAFDVVE
jgi:hypothetical protein